eukprot:1158743-Pelagomonas_calceolata.AAC.39
MPVIIGTTSKSCSDGIHNFMRASSRAFDVQESDIVKSAFFGIPDVIVHLQHALTQQIEGECPNPFCVVGVKQLGAAGRCQVGRQRMMQVWGRPIEGLKRWLARALPGVGQKRCNQLHQQKIWDSRVGTCGVDWRGEGGQRDGKLAALLLKKLPCLSSLSEYGGGWGLQPSGVLLLEGGVGACLLAVATQGPPDKSA